MTDSRRTINRGFVRSTYSCLRTENGDILTPARLSPFRSINGNIWRRYNALFFCMLHCARNKLFQRITIAFSELVWRGERGWIGNYQCIGNHSQKESYKRCSSRIMPFVTFEVQPTSKKKDFRSSELFTGSSGILPVSKASFIYRSHSKSIRQNLFTNHTTNWLYLIETCNFYSIKVVERNNVNKVNLSCQLDTELSFSLQK